jgi:serine/threonine protein kinase
MPQMLKRVGRYDVLEVIGRGGAAVVYLAQQRDLMRHVALKELAPYQASDTSFAERFVEESRLAGSMNHANVVTVHEYFEDGGVPYIAMDYLPYGSLRQYVGKLSIAQIAGVLEGVLAGLSHGEARGIAHRDLKPENLLVAADGRVKIADFGVARAYNKAATRAVVTVAGTTIGTPVYMSPEQALGHDLTPATDLYSLGIVAWELLTAQVPSRRRTRRSRCSTGTSTNRFRRCGRSRPRSTTGSPRGSSGCSPSSPRTASPGPTRRGWRSRTSCSTSSARGGGARRA